MFELLIINYITDDMTELSYGEDKMDKPESSSIIVDFNDD